jgi:hypothetical protein
MPFDGLKLNIIKGFSGIDVPRFTTIVGRPIVIISVPGPKHAQ